MKIVITPDSFKGSISSKDICKVIENTILKIKPKSDVLSIPVSDGGEGFVDALFQSIEMEIIQLQVSDPLGNIISAEYGISKDTAYIEMAQSSGLQLLNDIEKNPLKTTTYGFGEMIMDAIDHGIQNFVFGIGGSATNDGGTGMAQALGYKFYDISNNLIYEKMNGSLIGEISRIAPSNLPELNIKVACDVKNPLLGKNGATFIYARQKGAKDLQHLESNMTNLEKCFKKDLGKNVSEIKGSGAAGGLGAGLMAFLDAELVSGSKLVLDSVNFDKIIQDADLIITGEGKFDSQTSDGKIISEIVDRANSNNIPVYSIFGIMDNSGSEMFEKSIQLIDFANAEETMKNPEKYLEMATRELFNNM